VSKADQYSVFVAVRAPPQDLVVQAVSNVLTTVVGASAGTRLRHALHS